MNLSGTTEISKTRTAPTRQKALALNLDPDIYGTIAEIGAGQETSRWFFRVGAAAGTIAKTMSAYDMTVSDEVYGKSGRYVSRERVEAMLEKEFNLLIQRLSGDRGENTRFFAFANTVAARNFQGTNECHGWIGLRFQEKPGAAPSTIILHVNMLDPTNLQQQEALGVLGVNLIHAVFLAGEDPVDGLKAVSDNLEEYELEVDVSALSGPAFEGVDPAHTGMSMLRSGLANVVLFNREGTMAPPSEVLRKRPIIVRRVSPAQPLVEHARVMEMASKAFIEENASDLQALEMLDFSFSDEARDDSERFDQVVGRVRETLGHGEWTMASSLRHNYTFTDYLRRYSNQPLRFVVGTSTFAMLLNEMYYQDLRGGILEATGRLFTDDVKIYVHPMKRENFYTHLESSRIDPNWVSVGGDDMIRLSDLEFRPPTNLLYQYVLEAGWIKEIA